MEKELIFALISAIIYLIGVIPYWRDIFSGRTTVHIFTYGLWWVLVSFNAFVLLKNSEYYALIPSGLMWLSLTGATLLGFVHFRKIQINWFDWMCLGLGIFSVLYWFLSRNILNTVILTLIIDLIAFLPTFKKGWIAPWTESILIYFMSAIGQIATLLSLSTFENEESMFFWGYLFFANLTFFFMVAIRRYYLKGGKSIFE